MTSPRFLYSLVIGFGLCSGGAHAACEPNDAACMAAELAKEHCPQGYHLSSDRHSCLLSGFGGGGGGTFYGRAGGSGRGGGAGGRAGGATIPIEGNGNNIHISPGGDSSTPLHPVRAYLRAKDIPPVGAGAYGLVVFHSKATPANRSKLRMVCNAFVAFFPRNETSTAPLKDQMITIWPLDNPDAVQAKKDDCDFALAHYDLNASEAAITDARLQHANFDGEGPYLVGWSPANARGAPDKLVLVIDMSADNSQALIDQKFLFWKKQIVEDPSRWRNGFSIESVRAAIRIFADQYGQAMLDAIKLIGIEKP
jgi:hypothetical protein